jgi:hypothetical protein
MNTEQGCVILFTDRRTGSERYGCLDEDAPPWTMNQPTPTIKLVKTLDEAKLSPILDETFAAARAQRFADLHPGVTYRILRPFQK